MSKVRSDYIIFDISNLLYRCFFANKNQDDETTAGLAHHMALMTLNKYFKLYNPAKKVIMTFDRPNWRKEYTESDECISGKIYKGHRRQNMTQREREKFERFTGHLKKFEEIMRDRTSVICLAAERLEADDLVAGFVQGHPNDDHVIISADKDMMQLLKYENVRLVDPATGKDRDLREYDYNADLFMFEKCLRGDTGDNVQSAYPRIRKIRIRKAYTDDFERVNMMNESWRDNNKKEYIVRHLFKENQLLMDLSKQPEDIRKLMDDTIAEGLENPGKFNYFKFLAFCGKYELKNIAKGLEQYVPLLSK